MMVSGESALHGGQVGHFHDMYIKYMFAKHVAFNFGFHFWDWASYFEFHKVNDINIIWEKKIKA
jgi:hypothetical protein